MTVKLSAVLRGGAIPAAGMAVVSNGTDWVPTPIQPKLESNVNLKSINGESLLGSENLQLGLRRIPNSPAVSTYTTQAGFYTAGTSDILVVNTDGQIFHWKNGAAVEVPYQAKLVSGDSIKTINGVSILGNGNLTVNGGLSPTAVLLANYVLVANDLARIDNTAGGITLVSVPTTPADGARVAVFDVGNSCAAHNVLFSTGAGAATIEGDATGINININGAYVELMYVASTNNWKTMATPNSSVIGLIDGGGA